MEIVVQNGLIGLESPSMASSNVVVITRGTMSRTGRTMGHVDEGYCVQVAAYPPKGAFSRFPSFVVRLFASDLYDASARNRLGSLGAFVAQRPAQAAIDAVVEEARKHLESGEAAQPLTVRRVAAETVAVAA